jgi:hypothetical protein
MRRNNDALQTQMGNTKKTKTRILDNKPQILRGYNKTTLTQNDKHKDREEPDEPDSDAESIYSDNEETNFSSKQPLITQSKLNTTLKNVQHNKPSNATKQNKLVNKTPLQSQKPSPSQTLSSPSQTLSSPSPLLLPSSPSSPLPSQPNTPQTLSPHNTARSNTSNVSTVSALTDASKSSRTSKLSNTSTSSRTSVSTKKFITSQNNTFEINNDKKKDDDDNYYYDVTLSNEKNNNNINDKFLIPKIQDKKPKIMEIVKQHPTPSQHNTRIIEGNYLEQTNITGEIYAIVTVDEKKYKVIIKKKSNPNPNNEIDIISTTKNEYTVQPYNYHPTF